MRLSSSSQARYTAPVIVAGEEGEPGIVAADLLVVMNAVDGHPVPEVLGAALDDPDERDDAAQVERRQHGHGEHRERLVAAGSLTEEEAEAREALSFAACALTPCNVKCSVVMR